MRSIGRATSLRAVAEQVGVSHNAPYRHFSGRSALLAAVAERDFDMLKQAFDDQNRANQNPETALRASASALIKLRNPAPGPVSLVVQRPQLPPDASLKDAAYGAFTAFSCLVKRSQQEGVLPSVDTISLTGLIYAALHGAIDLHIGGRASAKGRVVSRIRWDCSLIF